MLPGLYEQPLYPLSDHLPLLPVALLAWALPLLVTRRYRSHRTAELKTEASAILKTAIAATALLLIAVFVVRLDLMLLDDRFSRTWLLLFSSLAFLLLLAEKIALRLLSRDLRRHGLNQRTVLIAGAPEAAAQLAESIEDHPHWGLRIVGLVHSGDGSAGTDGPSPVLGGMDDVSRIVSEHVVDDVFFTVTPRELPALKDVIDGCRNKHPDPHRARPAAAGAQQGRPGVP